jgi:alpha-tubulin suppressor-like RCC1 family protein
MVRYEPVRLPLEVDLLQVVGGFEHTCALAETGRVWCWGRGYDGELGDGTRVEYVVTPQEVPGVGAITAIGVGPFHVCALSDAEGIHCWGRNSDGQLGDGVVLHEDCNASQPGVQDCSSVPVRASSIPGARGLLASHNYTCAVTTTGLHCWGAPPLGVTVVPGSSTAEYAVGRDHGCRLDDGEVACWGSNTFGGLGTPAPPYESAEPLAVSLPGRAVDISVGDHGTCAVLTDGTAWCWTDGAMFQIELPDT